MKECGMEELLKTIQAGEREAAVSSFLVLSRDQQLTLLDKLRDAKSESVGSFLSAALDKVKDKPIQKTIKTLLFRLKTQGVRVEEPKITGESVLRKVEVVREQTAFLSNYDPEGMRVILLALEIKKKQYLFMHAVSHFSRGLQELTAMPASKDDVEAILKDYLFRTQRPMVLPMISPSYGYYLIDEASGVSGKYTAELGELRPFMSGLKGEVRKPEDVLSLPVPAGAQLKSAEDLFADSLFEPFSLTWDQMEEQKKEFETAVNPSIVLPPHMVEERRQDFLRKLIGDEKLKPTARFLRRLLEDYTYLFYALGEPENFRSTVERLPDEQFLQDAMLHFVRRALEKKEPEQEGVLVNPFEQRHPQPPFPHR